MSDTPSVTINGETYVPQSALEAMQDQRDNLRRTLAMVHMFLITEPPLVAYEHSVVLIERDTGWSTADAQAVAGVVEWARRESGL